jgi:methyltransferase
MVSRMARALHRSSHRDPRSRHRRRVVAAVTVVAAQRLIELSVSRRHERALTARGGVEHGAGHYPVMVGIHTAWLAGTLAEGWRHGPAGRRVALPALVTFIAMQPLRWWIIRSLGDRWTTRVFTVPGEQRLATGPYLRVRHPNYVVVAVEIATLPLAFGAPRTAVLASLADAVLLRHRIRVEDRALDLALDPDASPARVTGTGPPMADRLEHGRGDDRRGGP